MEIRQARLTDAAGIQEVCSAGYRHTYPSLMPAREIERVIEEFYNEERIKQEIETISQEWNGWFVAIHDEQVVGAGGGGFTGDTAAELYVLYLDPHKKRQGIGTRLLDAISDDQRKRGATEQWVAVAKDNAMGIPFYEARGFVFQSQTAAYGMGQGYQSIRYKRIL